MAARKSYGAKAPAKSVVKAPARGIGKPVSKLPSVRVPSAIKRAKLTK